MLHRWYQGVYWYIPEVLPARGARHVGAMTDSGSRQISPRFLAKGFLKVFMKFSHFEVFKFYVAIWFSISCVLLVGAVVPPVDTLFIR